ncbi:MAG: ABC transporter permease subunit [Planctomycetes bacterium]|nr:ABC transporter permease subunit [Planctomycetota bacterium]
MKTQSSQDYKPAKGLSSAWGNTFIFALLSAWAAFSLFGFAWVMYTSLKTDGELFASPWGLPRRLVPLSIAQRSSEMPQHRADNALDKDQSTFWATAPAAEGASEMLVFDLGEQEVLSKVTLRASGKPQLFPSDFVVELFDDGQWTRVVDVKDFPAPSEARAEHTFEFEPHEATRMRLVIDKTMRDPDTGLYGAEIAGIRLYRKSVHLRWDNYAFAWTISKMGSYTLNSIIVTTTSVFLIVIISSMAAYAVTKCQFRGKQFFFYYFLAGLAVPAGLLLVPLFMFLMKFNIEDLKLLHLGSWWLIRIRDFYLVDSRLSLILIYTTLGLPFTIFVLTGFFRTLPTALAEAAAIDGASEYGTFWKIFLPLAKPGLVTVSIFNFLYTWNEYQFALVFISNPKLKTLPLGIYSLMVATQHSSKWTALFAGLVILIVPTIVIFLILEDRITKGLTVGAVKG